MADPVSLDAHGGEPAVAAAAAPASLFAAVKVSIGSELPRHAARYLGEDEARVLTALDLLVLATLRRLAQRISTTDGAARLFADLASKRLDTELSAALDRLLVDDPGERDERPIPGEAVTARQFGRSTGSVVRAVAATTGLGVEAVRRLLVLTTPQVLVALRNYMRAGSLDAESLRQRLANEHPTVRWRLLRRALAAGEVRRDRRALALGALVVALAAAIALAWRSAVGPNGALEGAAGSGALRHLMPENGASPRASPSAGVSALVEFLSSDAAQVEYVFVLDGVQFEPGSATLKSSSNAQLREVAAALTAYPKARITLEAHAEGSTEEERALAEQRAVAVRAALAVFGVPLARTNHAGVGDTDRAGGHRVEARVTRR
jgi:outer membrane protein OmpA-like peptidoglycan-associated protein